MKRAERFAGMPFNRNWGFQFAPRAPGRAEIRLEPREEHLQVGGVVHGGVIATLADTAGVYAIYPDLDDGRTITSIEFKLNFLRAGRIGRGALSARARALKVGRSVATSEVDVFQAGELVAKGLFTYLVMNIEVVGKGSKPCPTTR